MRLLTQFREGHPWPNGGYAFKDGRTGRKFDGMSADLKLQAQNVIKHRQANPHIYPPDQPKYLDLDWVMLEIEDYMCKENPAICGGDAQPKVRKDPTFDIPLPTEPCTVCGFTSWSPNWCKTCGSGKVEGFKCGNCGNIKK